MSTLSGLEIFETIVKSRGRILRAEADREGETAEVLVLTFDVGRVQIRSGDDGLVISHAKDRGAVPADLIAIDEKDPWWRLLGQPATAAWPGGPEEGIEEGVAARGLSALMILKLRFREESNNPRVLLLESTGRSVRVSLE
jgi:hypothetical protein